MKLATLNCDDCGMHEAFIDNEAKWGELYNCVHCDGPAEYTVGDSYGIQGDEYVGGKYVQAVDKTYYSKSEMKQDFKAKGVHIREHGEDRQVKENKAHSEALRKAERRKMIEKTISRPWKFNVPEQGHGYKQAGHLGIPKTVELDPNYTYRGIDVPRDAKE